jgi:hypothetical protein
LHAAALALTAGADSENAAAQLLLDILSVFLETDREKIFSRDLADILRHGHDGLRSLALKDSAFDEYAISKLLRPYGIKPATIRIGKEVNKGYARVDFREALKHYVSGPEIEERKSEIRRRLALRAEALAETEREAGTPPEPSAWQPVN